MSSERSVKAKRLGRGLETLLGPINTAKETNYAASAEPLSGRNFSNDRQIRNSVREIRLDDICANPYQSRSVWNEQELKDLSDSIKANGIIQPIIVRQFDSGYQIIAGERRYRAAKLASLESIPAIVRTATDEQLLEIALVENIQRVDLNPIERAKAYESYIHSFSLTQAEASERLGEDRSVIANYLRLLELPDEIKQMLVDGQLSMGHARAILGIGDEELRRKLANRAFAGRLSVRKVEKLVRKYLEQGDKGQKNEREKSAHILELQSKLSRKMGTKVKIQARKDGQQGKMIIEFKSLDEFDRIIECLGLSSMEAL